MKLKKVNNIKLSELPRDIQLQLRATPHEIENSSRTNRQNYVLVKRTLVIDGEIYHAELRIGNCDIRQSGDHYYDDTIGVFFDADTGREQDPRTFARDKAADLYATTDLDECYVTITRQDEVNTHAL